MGLPGADIFKTEMSVILDSLSLICITAVKAVHLERTQSKEFSLLQPHNDIQ